MAITITPVTSADATFSASGLAAWNAGMQMGGMTANALLYSTDATTLAQDGTNLLYTTSPGPRLQVGSGSTTTKGWYIGYYGFSGGSAIWPTNVTPSASNYVFYADANNTQIAGPSNINFIVGGSTKAILSGTAGAGLTLSGLGTATTDVQALSATQTWNAAGVAFTGAKLTFTNTASAAGSSHLSIYGGSAGTNLILQTTEDNGPRLQVGSSGTSAGLILGYGLASGQASIWNAALTPATNNRMLWGDNTGQVALGNSTASTFIDGTGITFRRGGSYTQAAVFSTTAGSGLNITAGTATTDVQALSATQTWDASGVAFKANKTVVTPTASAAGSMLESWEYNTGQGTGVSMLTELTTINAAASTDTTIQMPANSLILGVSVRVTVAVTCTSTFTVGDSGSAARFSTAAVSKAATSTDPGTKAGVYYNATATAVRITPDTVPSDNTGRVRVTIHYIVITPPTS